MEQMSVFKDLVFRNLFLHIKAPKNVSPSSRKLSFCFKVVDQVYDVLKKLAIVFQT